MKDFSRWPKDWDFALRSLGFAFTGVVSLIAAISDLRFVALSVAFFVTAYLIWHDEPREEEPSEPTREAKS